MQLLVQYYTESCIYMKTIEVHKKLLKTKKEIYSVADLKKILDLRSDNSIYHAIQRLEKDNILEKITNGIYQLKDIPSNDFLIANNIYYPSYISLDSALNYYGILIQSPYMILSATTRRNKTKSYNNKEFVYLHLSQNYFFDYIKEKDFLIATPEKALVDTVFFTALGKTKTNLSELNFLNVNKIRLRKIREKIKNKAFHVLFKELKI